MAARKGKRVAVHVNDERGIMSLYLRGYTQTEIAAAIGSSQPRVCATLKKIRERTAASIRDDMEGYLLEMSERTMVALRALAPKVEAGDAEAIRTQNQTIERLAKLLGLDKQQKTDERAAELALSMVAARDEMRKLLAERLGD
jgi:hypothetical protein